MKEKIFSLLSSSFLRRAASVKGFFTTILLAKPTGLEATADKSLLNAIYGITLIVIVAVIILWVLTRKKEKNLSP